MIQHMKSKHAIDIPESKTARRPKHSHKQGQGPLYNQPVDPTSLKYLQVEGRAGESDALDHFKEVYYYLDFHKKEPMKQNNLYRVLLNCQTPELSP